MKRSILPIFIPHLGCPHDCVFCDQKQIASPSVPGAGEVQKIIEEGLRYAKCPQISFYGGSFTAIDRAQMIDYLEAARPYIADGRCHSIRLSTRPDAIDREVLEILKTYGVQTIELGAQSMSEDVLRKAGRGHTAAHTASASRLIRECGFELILQMMIGLPGSTVQDEIMTAEKICALGASGARIYPTVVFADTALCDMMQAGQYQPLSVDDAVCRSAEVLAVFEKHSVQVIRIGLCASDHLTDPACAVAGANHPALGELVRSELYYRNLRKLLLGASAPVQTVYIPARELSVAIGQHRQNLLRLQGEFGSQLRLAAANCGAPTLHEKETEHCT